MDRCGNYQIFCSCACEVFSNNRLGSQKEPKLLTCRDRERVQSITMVFFCAVIVEILGCVGELWLTACRPKCQAGLGGTSASNRGPTTGVRLSCRATDLDVHLLEIHSYVPHPKPQMCRELVILIVSKHLPHALPCSPLHWQDQTTPPPGDQDYHSHDELQNMYCISSVWMYWFSNKFSK